MPLNLPILDDRDYSDLVAEAISMIPRYAPSWTNHNPSDPGITLIELLAYFTEMLIYRLDRISLENKINFLKLLLGSKATEKSYENLKKLSTDQVDTLIKQAVLDLKQPYRAITADDYEFLANQAALKISKDINVIRAHCIVGKNLATDGYYRDTNRSGHISVVLIAGKVNSPYGDKVLIEEADHNSYANLTKEVQKYLEPRCLLTTRLHIVKPCYLWVSVGASIRSRSAVPLENLQKISTEKLNYYFSPFQGGGRDGLGWPLGRNFYLSEIVDVLERIPEVDFIENIRILGVALTSEDLSKTQAKIGIQVGISSTVGVDSLLGITGANNKDRLILNGTGKLSGIMLKPYELIKIVLQEENLTDHVLAVSEAKDNYV